MVDHDGGEGEEEGVVAIWGGNNGHVWQEDVAHLRNQLTEEEPGRCERPDMNQHKIDQRKFKSE